MAVATAVSDAGSHEEQEDASRDRIIYNIIYDV